MAKTELIKLDGTLIKEDGTKERSNFFKFLQLRPDDYSDIAFTPAEANKIRAHLQHLSTGASAVIPLICGGAAKCPFKDRCPLIRVDKERREIDPEAKAVTPVGRQCLVEIELLNEWTRLYVQEYEVDPQLWTEVMMVRELAELELMLWRLNNNMAKPQHAELVQETVVGIDRDGNALTRLEVNAFMEAKERLQNRKSKVIKSMVGDRHTKTWRDATLRRRAEEDPSSKSAELRGEVERLVTRAKELDLKLKEKEGKIIDMSEEDVIQKTTQGEQVPLTPEDLIDSEE
jgi:hypothetical protein